MDGPLEVDSEGTGTENNPRYYVIIDRFGRVICDTLNSDYRFSPEEGYNALKDLVDTWNKSAGGLQ